MDQEYLLELNDIFESQMETINQDIETKFNAQYQGEYDRANAYNMQATYNHGMGAAYLTEEKRMRDYQNTQAANEARINEIDERKQAAIAEASERAANILGASIFEDFGGSQEAAFQQLQAYEEQKQIEQQNEVLFIEDHTQNRITDQRAIEDLHYFDQEALEAIRREAEQEFNEVGGSNEAKLKTINGEAEQQFNMASGRTQEKLDAVQGQAEQQFNLSSGNTHQKLFAEQEKVKAASEQTATQKQTTAQEQNTTQEQNNEQQHTEQEQEVNQQQTQEQQQEPTVEILVPIEEMGEEATQDQQVAIENGQEISSLDSNDLFANWQQTDRFYDYDEATYITTTQTEAAQDTSISALISQRFDRSESKDESISY